MSIAEVTIPFPAFVVELEALGVAAQALPWVSHDPQDWERRLRNPEACV